MQPKKDKKCSSCGGYDFSLMDGFLYCAACGSLFENFEELVLDDDDTRVTGKSRIRTRKKPTEKDAQDHIDGEIVETQRKKFGKTNKSTVDMMSESLKKKTEFFAKQARRKDPKIISEGMPDYLYIVGLRLSTFSKILAKTAFILVNDMHFPASYSKTVLAIFQKYLAHCEIAFCSTEITNVVEEQFVAILENQKFATQEVARKRKKLARLKTEGKAKLNQSEAAWQLLTQGDLTENLEMEDDMEDTDESDEDGNRTEADADKTTDVTKGFVRKISTLLTKEAVRKASQIRLGLEYLVAILFTSALSCGCRNVLLSDFVRWVREDRFHISYCEIRNTLRGGDEKLNSSLGQGEYASYFDFVEMEMKYPLYEIHRILTLFSQSLDIGKNMANVIFAKVAARLIDNLNLPQEFLRRVLLIESIVPCDLLVDSRRQVDCKNGYDLGELTAMLPRMRYKKFAFCFGRKQFQTYTHEEIVLSVETKVFAYILLAIKMTIDIDEQKVETLDLESEMFDIDTWIHQLEMRILCWEGHDMSMVFKPSCPIPKMTSHMPFANNAFGRYQMNELFLVQTRMPFGFRKCIPSKMSFHSTQNLPTVFKSRANNVDESLRNIPDAILSPLKFQAKLLKKEMSADQDQFENCDENSIKTFFKSFSNCKLGEKAEKELEFDDIFPACSKYVRYSRPDWTSRCTSKREEDRCKQEGDHRVYLSYKTIEDLMDCASDSFSERFRFLLDSFALLIGEDVNTLYAAFVMLEMQFLDAEKVESIKQSLLNYKPFFLKRAKFGPERDQRNHEITVLPSCAISKIEEIQFFNFKTPIFENEGFTFEARTSDTENLDIDEELSDEDEMGIDDESNPDSDNECLPIYRRKLKEAREEYKRRVTQVIVEGIDNRPPKEFKTTRADLNSYEFESLFALLAIKYW